MRFDIRGRNPVLLILLTGMAVRLILAPMFSDYNDFPYWTGVAFDVMTGDGIYQGYNLWYPPMWGYVISIMTPFLDLFGVTPLETIVDASSESGYSLGNGQIVSPITVFILKIPLILADVFCGYIVYSIARMLTDDRKKQISVLLLWTFNPLTIYVSAVQGQIDPISTMFLLLSVWSYLRNSYLPAGAFIAASVLTKPFTSLVVLPMLALIWAYQYDLKDKFKSSAKYLFGGIAMSVLILLPQLINGEMGFVTGFLTSRYSSDPPLPSGFEMSVYANGMSISDLFPSVSNLNTFFFISFILSLVLTVFVAARGRTSGKGAVLIIPAATICHLMWYSATGYIQYYVPVVAMLTICTVYDRRFNYAVWGIVLLTLICSLHGFANFYQLYELGWASIGTLQDVSDFLDMLLDVPNTLALNLKFLPVLLAVILSIKLARDDYDA